MSATEHHKPELTIDQLDPSGDVRTLADDAGAWDPAGTRRDMLRRAGLAGVGVAAGGTLLSAFMSPFEAAAQSGKLDWVKRRSAGNDVKIGNYALTLEYLEAAFYRQAVAKGGLSDPDVRRFARTVRDHEVAHVKALKQVLGKAAVKAPRVDFGNAVTDQATFLEVSAAIEPVGTAAYAGAGPWIKSLPILKAALSIHSVEANHAAWVAALRQYKFGANASPSPRAFNPAYSRKRTLRIVAETGFIQ
jgi:Ferritin-like domain